MFISYPMGGQGEIDGFHRYAISEILAGNLQIGNLRYSPGYPLFISPFVALSKAFGRLDDRIVLLIQIAFSSRIPFLLYDILRTRHSPRAAFFVGLISLMDPLGLQWSHFSLPVWLAATCLVFSSWLLHYAEHHIRSRRRGGTYLVCSAGLVSGLGVLGRWIFAILVVGIVSLLWFGWIKPKGERIRQIGVFSISSLMAVLLVHFTVQVPVTGVWELSSVLGLNLMETITWSGLKIDAAHGARSKHLLHLSRLEPLPNSSHPYDEPNGIWDLWQESGPWASLEERETFLNQQATGPFPDLSQGKIHENTFWLIYYLGPVEYNRLLVDVFIESVSHQFWAWLRNIPQHSLNLLLPPLSMDSGFPNYTLPRADLIEYNQNSGMFGFVRAVRHATHFYTGQWVWRPGIEIFSRLWAPLNALRFLVFPALVWALFTRHRVYTAIGFLLLLYVFVLGAIDYPEQRIYAIVYPLGPVLVGGFLVTLWERAQPSWQRLRKALAATRPD
ncbi:MAG: glycosyltransferase family 39 protein [Chloroflexi bacterium]|nr:glycosyltransferase family 39 protein [Chloroflexota bacterium]